jgi:subtilisin family serine protease
MSELLPAWSDAFVPPREVATSGLVVSAEWAFGDSDGSGVTVAIVDSGVDFDHPDVRGPAAPGAALQYDAETGDVLVEEGAHDDLYGHGTACAAIVRRHAPACSVMSVRVLGERLTGKGPVFAAGVRWALAHGARVLNLSLSSSKPAMADVFREVADEAAHGGAVLVCAMNNVPARTYPSQFASVISVAAAEEDRLLIADSAPADFGAPGIDVTVAWLNGGFLTVTGNSFAAPWVAGLATRIVAAHPELRPYEVKTILRNLADNARPGCQAS